MNETYSLTTTYLEGGSAPAPALVLRLREPGQERGVVLRTGEAYLRQFVDIMERHQSSTDALSLNIYRWGEEISLLLLEMSSMHKADFAVILAKKVDELRRHILINPLDCAPLQEPVLVDGVVWEGWMLRHYQTLSPYSPYDRRAFEVESVHVFAAEMISLLSEVVYPSEDEDPFFSIFAREIDVLKGLDSKEGQLDQEEAGGIDPHLALEVYQELAQAALALRKREEEADYFTSRQALFSQKVELIERQIAENMDRLERALDGMSDFFEERLQFIKESHERIVNGLRELLAFVEKENNRLESKLTDAESKITGLEGRIGSLETRLRQAEAQNECNRQAANDSGGGGCVIM